MTANGLERIVRLMRWQPDRPMNAGFLKRAQSDLAALLNDHAEQAARIETLEKRLKAKTKKAKGADDAA